MTRLETIKLFRMITIAYPMFDGTDTDKIAFWHEQMRDVSLESAVQNLKIYARTEKFPPSIADLSRSTEPEKDFSSQYHESMRGQAQQHLTNLEEWREKAVGPTPEQRERVRAIFAKRKN
ncbi:hypothetical protein SD70_29645 [Gordoniibacillus kamchatkensis]|uniref:Replicative helicase inhibitor G39P N-terminal domain-containing protein n=1 Tax=Gordoniibacillus kamchatkensis TaxID=1590651 RepID=A0ABR5AAB0_9BACL|nr:replicative helicase loader/inhibitor [Paenibacillus sp. VKM B-2647]KIL37954.1 hypothetical protein SD70_29645 [Paenibacillus sp. VKM B-2647]